MQEFILILTHTLRDLSSQLPVPWFILIGSFIEELFSPIPSALITTISATLSIARGKGVPFLLLLSLIGGIGKTVASLLLYVLVDKLEDVFMKKIGPFFGINHEDIESIGKRLTKDWRDDALVFALRAIPIAPTATVSVVCGLIKMNILSFALMTYAGYSTRIFLLLLIPYLGIDIIQSLQSPWATTLSVVGGIVFTGLITAYIFRTIRTERKQPSHDMHREDERKNTE